MNILQFLFRLLHAGTANNTNDKMVGNDSVERNVIKVLFSAGLLKYLYHMVIVLISYYSSFLPLMG